jgi:hypothetical protein
LLGGDVLEDFWLDTNLRVAIDLESRKKRKREKEQQIMQESDGIKLIEVLESAIKLLAAHGINGGDVVDDLHSAISRLWVLTNGIDRFRSSEFQDGEEPQFGANLINRGITDKP